MVVTQPGELLQQRYWVIKGEAPPPPAKKVILLSQGMIRDHRRNLQSVPVLQRKLARSMLQGRLDLTGGTTLVLEMEEEGQRSSGYVMDVHRWQSSTGAQPCMENDHTALPACLLPPTPASLSQGSDSLY